MLTVVTHMRILEARMRLEFLRQLALETRFGEPTGLALGVAVDKTLGEGCFYKVNEKMIAFCVKTADLRFFRTKDATSSELQTRYVLCLYAIGEVNALPPSDDEISIDELIEDE